MDFRSRLAAAFQAHGVSRTFSKGEFLIREGDIERSLHLVENGLLRVFRVSEFEEQIIRFGYSGDFMSSLSSFIKQTPSEFYIDSVRKTQVRSISRELFYSIVNEDATTLRSYAEMTEQLVCQQIEREVDLLTGSPAERLERVLKRSPNLFQEVPLKYIASYLRMTPETLSRIRNS